MLLTIGMFMPSIQVGFVLQARGIESAAVQGTIVATTSIVAIFSAGFYGFFRRWLSAEALLAIDALSMGLGVIVIGLSSSSLGIVIGCAIVGIGAGMSEPATASLIFDRTPPAVHALAMGLIVSALNLGIFINPLAMAPLRDSFGVVTAFELFGALMLVVTLLLLVSGRKRKGGVPADRLATSCH
ncbi:MAG TPA: MFS transporter [Sphingomonas sp.]|nr:MFS transporter [Sphingomonas sp.]